MGVGGTDMSYDKITKIGISGRFIRIYDKDGLNPTDVDHDIGYESQFSEEHTLFDVLGKAIHPIYDSYIEEQALKARTKKDDFLCNQVKQSSAQKLVFLLSLGEGGWERRDF